MARIKQAPRWTPKLRAKAATRQAASDMFQADLVAAEKLAQELLSAVAESSRGVLGPELVALTQAAKADWPVRTGKSRDAIELKWRRGQSALTGAVNVKVPYAIFINRGATVKELIFEPADAARERWGKAIIDGIAKELK